MSKVESVFGTKLEVRSAAIVRESVSVSPMLIFPPMVTSPIRLESPAIYNLPKEPVEKTEPLILPLNVAKCPISATTTPHGFACVPNCPSEPLLGTKFLVDIISHSSYNDGI